jgi:hypothetical protein
MHADAMPAVRDLEGPGIAEEEKRGKEVRIDLLGSVVETI